MLGWWFDVNALKSVLPGLATMKFNTALCFFLSGASLYLSVAWQGHSRWRKVAFGCAIVVVAISVATAIEYATGGNLFVDQLFMRDLETEAIGAPPGRMSVATTVLFVLTGLALTVIDFRIGDRVVPAQLIALPAIFGGFFGVLGHLFEAGALYRFPPFSSMAVHTAALFVVVGVGVLFARPGNGLMAVLSSESVGGRLARWFVPSSACAIAAFGWIRLKGQSAGFYESEVGVALFTAFSIVFVSVAVWFVARYLNHVHDRLKEQVRANARFTALVEHSQDAIVAEDLAGIVIEWNPGAEQLLGYSASEMIGESILKVTPPDLHHEVEEIRERIRHRKRVDPVETRQRRKDGSIVNVSVAISPILDESGRIIGASKVARDITEGRKSEARIREQATLLDKASDSIVVRDLEGVVRYMNKAAVRIYGLSASETIGRKLSTSLLSDPVA
jgi:PAS domain S-box-containing protein